jgi:hypothetical protein
VLDGVEVIGHGGQDKGNVPKLGTYVRLLWDLQRNINVKTVALLVVANGLKIIF